MLLPLYFHWFSTTCSHYLCSDNRYQTVRILSLLIDFYLITLETYMDISPTFLSSLFARAWHLFSTYSHFSFNIYLGAPFTIKTYIQLWNKPAFAPHSSELIHTHLNPLNHLRWLSQTCPPCLASFAFILVSLLVPLVCPHILSESHMALKEHSCQLRHYLFGTNRIPDLTLTDWPLPTNYSVGVWRSPETVRAL